METIDGFSPTEEVNRTFKHIGCAAHMQRQDSVIRRLQGEIQSLEALYQSLSRFVDDYVEFREERKDAWAEPSNSP